MSVAICDRCNRIRLTADGFLKLCLQYPYGYDLKTLLRSKADDDTIRQAIEAAVADKPAAHSFGTDKISDKRKMVQIGG